MDQATAYSDDEMYCRPSPINGQSTGCFQVVNRFFIVIDLVSCYLLINLMCVNQSIQFLTLRQAAGKLFYLVTFV